MMHAGNRVARLWLPLVSALEFKVIPFDSLSHPPCCLVAIGRHAPLSTRYEEAKLNPEDLPRAGV